VRQVLIEARVGYRGGQAKSACSSARPDEPLGSGGLGYVGSSSLDTVRERSVSATAQ
jgi:hypothetical protein